MIMLYHIVIRRRRTCVWASSTFFGFFGGRPLGSWVILFLSLLSVVPITETARPTQLILIGHYVIRAPDLCRTTLGPVSTSIRIDAFASNKKSITTNHSRL